jgi:hypothetical protein
VASKVRGCCSSLSDDTARHYALQGALFAGFVQLLSRPESLRTSQTRGSQLRTKELPLNCLVAIACKVEVGFEEVVTAGQCVPAINVTGSPQRWHRGERGTTVFRDVFKSLCTGHAVKQTQGAGQP